jgi:peroxiredoxin (alkyl hydroperoxide reductase subunit C)
MTTLGLALLLATGAGIFFSHPADFTPVCTTEFMTFASMADEFKALNAELLGLSIDSTFSHIAWLRTIKEKIPYKGMKGLEASRPPGPVRVVPGSRK